MVSSVETGVDYEATRVAAGGESCPPWLASLRPFLDLLSGPALSALADIWAASRAFVGAESAQTYSYLATPS